jgi:glutathione S-transferase
MQLIGMLDSPYVRRVAIGLQLLGLPFTHRPISVFRGMPEFGAINPLLKAPTLVCDDGTVLMDSTLILDYAQALAAPRTLRPAALADRTAALRVTGLALAACEKAVQLVYERALRPPEKRHAPWIERVSAQMKAGFALLEAELAQRPPQVLDDASVTAAVVWFFACDAKLDALDEAAHPRLRAWSSACEARAEFRAAPHGDGTYPVAP